MSGHVPLAVLFDLDGTLIDTAPEFVAIGLRRLMRPGYNTAVGALYYADLIDNYKGNRVLALAAYNAGPNRVRRWSEGTMSIARWVDTIPFKETREYVRAVLAYTVIYRLKAGKPAEMLSDLERDYQY